MVKALEEKRRKKEELLSMVKEVEKVRRDWHRKREPRDCGITVHPGIGCDLGCIYCYIADMGFPTDKVEPYPLKGEELALALMLNPSVTPGPYGTYVAVGSVTEPFHPLLLERTSEYLKWLKWLGNYTQISYKMIMSDEKIEKIASNSDEKLSVLVSISSLKKAKTLEPKLPPPETRLEMGEKLLRSGKGVVLFLRPIIPGITDAEVKDILELSLSYNIKDVVLGGLRVTERILRNLQAVGVELEGRLKRIPRGREQVYVNIWDLRKNIEKLAVKLGMRVLYTACDANARHHNEYCWDSCIFNKELCSSLPRIDEMDLREGIEMMGGKLLGFKVREPLIELETVGLNKSSGWIIQMAYRRQVILKVRKGGRKITYKFT